MTYLRRDGRWVDECIFPVPIIFMPLLRVCVYQCFGIPLRYLGKLSCDYRPVHVLHTTAPGSVLSVSWRRCGWVR